jgi:hypothetical protein
VGRIRDGRIDTRGELFLGASAPQRSPTRNLGRPSLSTLFNPAARQTAHSSITALNRILGNCPSFFFLFDLTQREWHNARGIIISVWVPSRFKPTVRLLTPGLYLVHSPPDSWSILSHLCPVDSTNFTGTSRCVWRYDRRDAAWDQRSGSAPQQLLSRTRTRKSVTS